MSTLRLVTRLDAGEPAVDKNASVESQTARASTADTKSRVKALKKRFPKILARLAE